ncbi:hypothetical protein CK203_045920 [Vitis vinifera]|uniref:Uncharacterized protein n=1 Tax=Vitis vinifera TaxID=29760 RepID=A0A438I4X5_VITVI|nr:hypothetical protein CK203_045920 [Vitis vinifera]
MEGLSRVGHLVQQCYYRFDPSFQGLSSFLNGFLSAQDSSRMTAMVATTPKFAYDSSYYPNSGATNHITLGIHNLMNKTEFARQDKIVMGNGTNKPSKGEKQREAKRKSKLSEEKQRGQQLQSSFALLEYFPKSIFYILYTISKLRKSRINALNRVRFGAEMRKIWPLEDNCSRLVRNFRTTPSKFAQPMRGANFPLFLPTPL